MGQIFKNIARAVCAWAATRAKGAYLSSKYDSIVVRKGFNRNKHKTLWPSVLY